MVGSPGASEMYDCEFQKNRLIHLHVSQERGTATLLTQYHPDPSRSHREDVREARESEGRLVDPGGFRFTIELFLLNDRLGQRPGEKVVVRVADDGRARLEGQIAAGQVRVIDFGTCMPDRHGHH